ncbi:hypothetical protein XH81_04920 [Bradyrhizobium sp. CCBAU 25360]|nr:hypothetical protein [Bradyrhizobium sp. CCBAU 25360]
MRFFTIVIFFAILHILGARLANEGQRGLNGEVMRHFSRLLSGLRVMARAPTCRAFPEIESFSSDLITTRQPPWRGHGRTTADLLGPGRSNPNVTPAPKPAKTSVTDRTATRV